MIAPPAGGARLTKQNGLGAVVLKKLYYAALALSVAIAGMSWEGRAQTISENAFRGLPNVSFQYYDVDGTDEASINKSMSGNGLRRPDGSEASAATEYRTNVRPFFQGTGAACKVTKLRIELGAIVILPRLKDPSVVPARIMTRWPGFLAGLHEHEAGHIRIAYKHLRALDPALLGTRCDDFRARYEAASARLRALQMAYDRDTDSGATQGARLQ